MTAALGCNYDSSQEAIGAEVKGLQLPGVNGVFVKTWPNDQAVTFPCVFVCLPQEAEDAQDGQFGAIDLIYPVQVLIADRTDANHDEMRKVYLGWRNAIARHLRSLADLPSVPECYDVQVRYGVAIDTNRPEYQYIVSGMVARVFCREFFEVRETL